MPQFQVPAINVQECSGWAEQDINLYNKLPYFFAKYQVDIRKTWPLWSQFGGKRRWVPNMGDTMRLVRKVPSPNLRQFATPNRITTQPVKDVIGVRETKVDAYVLHQEFESQVMYFLPSFQDFLNDSVMFTLKDIEEKKMRFEDIFMRSQAYYQSPVVWLAGAAPGSEALQSPVGYTEATSKTIAWLQAQIPQVVGNLSLETVARIVGFAENEQGIPVFSGDNGAKDGVGFTGMYCLVLSGEAYNQFTFDPYTLSNRPLDYNIINGRFKGSIFGQVTCKIESMPIRILVDANGVPSFPAPETIELNPNAYNYQETIPNPDYNAAQYEVAFLVGATAFESIEVGPPPKDFTSGTVPPNFAKLNWNGEVQITKNILVPCLDPDGNKIYDTNKYGKYLQLISYLTLGYAPTQRRNIIPIIFKRVRGPVTATS